MHPKALIKKLEGRKSGRNPRGKGNLRGCGQKKIGEKKGDGEASQGQGLAN